MLHFSYVWILQYIKLYRKDWDFSGEYQIEDKEMPKYEAHLFCKKRICQSHVKGKLMILPILMKDHTHVDCYKNSS